MAFMKSFVIHEMELEEAANDYASELADMESETEKFEDLHDAFKAGYEFAKTQQEGMG